MEGEKIPTSSGCSTHVASSDSWEISTVSSSVPFTVTFMLIVVFWGGIWTPNRLMFRVTSHTLDKALFIKLISSVLPTCDCSIRVELIGSLSGTCTLFSHCDFILSDCCSFLSSPSSSPFEEEQDLPACLFRGFLPPSEVFLELLVAAFWVQLTSLSRSLSESKQG